MKEEEKKKVTVSQWEEKAENTCNDSSHIESFRQVEMYLQSMEDTLSGAGMEGLSYTRQESEIEELFQWQKDLSAYVNTLEGEIKTFDQALYKGFQNEATEYLSRIKLEDYKTENTLGIQEHYTDVIDGNEISWTSNVEKLTMGDFLGITSLEGGNGRGELINIPQALRDFTDMFATDYESIKDRLKNENGKQITLEQYLTYLETMGEFQNTMDKPVAQFFSMLLDITIVIPLIEACWGYDLVTGEDLSDLDRGLKLVFAIIDIATLGSGVLATESLTMGATVIGKTMLIDLASVSAAYGVGKLGEELDLPLPITLLLSMGTGMAVSRVAGKIILQDGVGNVILEADAEAVDGVLSGEIGLKNSELNVLSYADLMSSEEATKYNQWMDLRRAGLDQQKMNEIILTNKGYRSNPSTYLSEEYIEAHLDLFSEGVTKLSAVAPTGQAGPPGGTFVMPKSVADNIIQEADGDILKLGQLLGLEPETTLGVNPVRLDIENPRGLRMPSGNELGANSQWIPGGMTSGRIPEAIIESPLPEEFILSSIFE